MPATQAPATRYLANAAWEALLSAHAVLMKEFAAEDIWGEVSMREYDVLYALSKCRGSLRLSELNRHVLLSQPALSRLVERLADRGLIDRRPDPADGRGLGALDLSRALRRGGRPRASGELGLHVLETMEAIDRSAADHSFQPVRSTFSGPEALDTGWDPKARLKDQDRDGIAAEMIYPTIGMVLCGLWMRRA